MPDSPLLSVRVRLFARYAELVGSDAVTVDLPADATVADAVAAVRALPGGSHLPSRPLVARNLEQVGPGVPLAPGDEIAVLPPMSGG